MEKPRFNPEEKFEVIKDQKPKFDPGKSFEISAKDSLQDDILGVPVSTIEGALNALPMAGTVAGGALGFGAAGPVGGLAGAGAGGFAGEAVANTIRSGLGLESAPKDSAEVWTDSLREGALGLAGEGAGQVISKVPALVRSGVNAARGSSKAAAPMVVDDAGKQLSFDDVGFSQTPKPNASEISGATKRISGVDATPGMISANPNIQNVENVLSQTPTIAGEKVRASYAPIRKGLEETTERLAGSPGGSAFEAGEQFKQGVTKRISEKVKPLSSQFEKIRESSRYIKPSQDSLNRSADRLLKQDLAEFSDLPQGQAIKKYAEMIRGAKNLDSLKQLRSSVGDDISAAINTGDGQTAMALGKVKGAIQRLERREILKSAIDSMPTKKQGEAAAKELIADLKGVNKGWRALMTELESIAKAGGINKISSPGHLSRLIDNMPSEKLAQKFFNTKNYQGLKDLKKFLPDEFEILRQNKLSEIAGKSMTKGSPDPVKLLRNIKNMGKEARQIVFGEGSEQMLKDMETVIDSFPGKVGASDTPRGVAWHEFLNPFTAAGRFGQEASSAMKYMLLQGKSSQKIVGPKTQSMLPRAVGYGAVGTMSKEDGGKGPNRWASDGLKNLQSIDSKYSSISQENIQQNPRLKELLIRASGLKAGSKGMQSTIRQIDKELGGR